METQPPQQVPIWRTPEFWRELAEEWRGPETLSTTQGICRQLASNNNLTFIDLDRAVDLLHEFAPTFRPRPYFFPIGDRASRAALCDKIADHLEQQ